MENLTKLEEYFNKLGSCVVAFSGGVDSAVLVSVAHAVLGNKMLAVTGHSPSVPARDLRAASAFCEKRGIPHKTVDTTEFADPNYISNSSERCFYCKGNLFDTIRETAVSSGFKFIVEGTNASELKGHRPGFGAKKERSFVVTPLADLGITKEDVRALARELLLEVADKPSTACLSSRVPFGVKIDAELLRRIDSAEELLIGMGVRQVRVRHNGDTARIETDAEGMSICVRNNGDVNARIKALGWKNVVLDLGGYVTGGGM